MKKILMALMFSLSLFSIAAVPPNGLTNNGTNKEDEGSFEYKKKMDELRVKRLIKEIEAEDASTVKKIEYSHTPVNGGIITITDRSIDFPKIITGPNATSIIKKINFFNRKNNFPIFLVMDPCYGGSVVGGDKIISAIKVSKAKIYIVVKSFAASMCAVIASTFAENAYFLKNAMILHHEVSNGLQGNTTAHKENVKLLNKWQEILFSPIAKRKGMTVEQFIKTLYEIKADGDATLFAQEAIKEKWIFNVVDGVEDGSFNERPNTSSLGVIIPGFEEDRTDLIGPEDFYFMYSKIKLIEAR